MDSMSCNEVDEYLEADEFSGQGSTPAHKRLKIGTRERIPQTTLPLTHRKNDHVHSYTSCGSFVLWPRKHCIRSNPTMQILPLRPGTLGIRCGRFRRLECQPRSLNGAHSFPRLVQDLTYAGSVIPLSAHKSILRKARPYSSLPPPSQLPLNTSKNV